MERCEVCGGQILTAIFRGSKVCSQICNKTRARSYSPQTAMSEADKYFDSKRYNKLVSYVSRRSVAGAWKGAN